MQQGGFGRRGVNLDGAPIAPERPAPTPAQPAPARSSYAVGNDGFSGWRWLVVASVFAIILLAWIEAAFSGTSLITPIDGNMLWAMRGLGAALGLIFALVLFKRVAEQNSTAKAVLCVAVAPLLLGFLFNEIAWRAADWAAFGFSQQTYEPAHYPIASISPGRKGRRDVISIDPFETGETTDIPVSDAQYNDLVKASASSCVTVMQRRAPSGAIEILNEGEYTLREPAPVEVSPCILGSSAGSGAN
jgi:hypothetical protein